jgi:hypothetical protein
MYREKKQASIFDSPEHFIGAELDRENRWIKLSELIPWERIEQKYKGNFTAHMGRPAKLARMALGSHLIKEKLCLSDRETVELIGEHPYLQFFIGMERFQPKAPFDASMMTWFRKRMTPEMIAEVNEYVTRGGGEDNRGGGTGGGPETGAGEEAAGKDNKGTVIVDATCAPSDIRFPTDVSLLNEAREQTEKMIDHLHKAGAAAGKKPRTYRRIARKDYLRFARNRNPRKADIRRAVRRQLACLRRNLSSIAAMGDGTLPGKMKARLETIRKLYGQQREMYEQRIHSVPNRIVSLHSPWVRPIVRGKTNAPVEFGAKVAVSMVDGYARVERLSWDAFNETTTLIGTIEKYREREGVYPERILADKIYRTRETLAYCKKRGIRMSGPKLGRPPADKDAYREQCRLERSEAGERNAIEGEFGVGKRRYNLDRLTARLKESGEAEIHLIFLSMNLWKKLRAFSVQILELISWSLKRPAFA